MRRGGDATHTIRGLPACAGRPRTTTISRNRTRDACPRINKLREPRSTWLTDGENRFRAPTRADAPAATIGRYGVERTGRTHHGRQTHRIRRSRRNWPAAEPISPSCIGSRAPRPRRPPPRLAVSAAAHSCSRATSAIPTPASASLTEPLTRFGRLDVLVNMASVYQSKSFDELTVADWDASLEIDLRSAWSVRARLRRRTCAACGGAASSTCPTGLHAAVALVTPDTCPTTSPKPRSWRSPKHWLSSWRRIRFS